MALSKEDKNLLALQDTDLKIAQLEQQVQNAPYRTAIQAVRAKIQEGEGRLKAIDAMRISLQERVDVLQVEIDEFAAKMTQTQSSMQASADHRAIQNMSKELETLLKQKEKRENEGMKLMEQRSQFGDAQQDTQEKLEALRTQEASDLAAFEEFMAKARTINAQLQKQKDDLRATLSDDLLVRYDKTKALRNGVGVGMYEDGKCGACSMLMSVSQKNAIEGSNEISACPSCKRLLVVDKA
jgi:predicted  nucleic acid-binding Zn-ribbon protein